MVTSTAIANPYSAGDRIHQMFGDSPEDEHPQQVSLKAPDTMKHDPPSTQAVLNACSIESLRNIYARATDSNGQRQPGRFLSAITRYTIMGGGVQSFKRSTDSNTVNELVGTIVRLAPYRVLYARPVGDERYAPSCGSVDLHQGYGEPGISCRSCPQAIYQTRDIPWCRHKSRLYMAMRKTRELAVVDLTSMSREGLEELLQWAGQHQVDLRDYTIKLTLKSHPRSPSSGNNRTSLLVATPGAIATDWTDHYRQAIEDANQVLANAEAAWLHDISQPGAGNREPARIGGDPVSLTPGATVLNAGADGYDSRQNQPLAAGNPDMSDSAFPTGPDDYDFGPPPEDWSDVDDLPF